jgi:hypothetical protein
MPTSVSSTYTGPIPGAYSASPLAQIAGVGSLLGALNTTPAGGGKDARTPAQNLYAGLYGVGSDIYKSLTGTKGIGDFATSQEYMDYIGAGAGAAFDPSLSDSAYLNDLYGLDIF